jgi:hypothetical protein
LVGKFPVSGATLPRRVNDSGGAISDLHRFQLQRAPYPDPASVKCCLIVAYLRDRQHGSQAIPWPMARQRNKMASSALEFLWQVPLPKVTQASATHPVHSSHEWVPGRAGRRIACIEHQIPVQYYHRNS